MFGTEQTQLLKPMAQMWILGKTQPADLPQPPLLQLEDIQR
jgi:hypothetical protein